MLFCRFVIAGHDRPGGLEADGRRVRTEMGGACDAGHSQPALSTGHSGAPNEHIKLENDKQGPMEWPWVFLRGFWVCRWWYGRGMAAGA